jgi:hypothetical protein
MVINNLPVLLIYKGVKLEQKVAPVVKAQKLSDDNNNNRRMDEQKKRNVKTTAALLRISKQGQNKVGTGGTSKTNKRSGKSNRLNIIV